MFDNKTILITGGTGSWGHELVSQLLEKFNPKEIRIYSRGEHKQVEMRRELSDPRLRFIIGDVRDKNILGMSMRGVDYVFHLAALKHVPICEENGWEAVLTNVYGTQNVIECAIENNIEKVVDVSTDKAVDAFNLYGVTKALGEKLIVNAGNTYRTKTKFVCIRGGNVMGTNGSVLPLFKRQLKEKNEITVTDPNMTRYLMRTKEAIGLVFQAVSLAVGGEIFVMRMPSTNVSTIAKVMTELFGNKDTKITNIGIRPGEKLDEVLVSKNEAPRTKELDEKYFVILPMGHSEESIYDNYKKLKNMDTMEFSSNNAKKLSEDEFKEILREESVAWN